MSRDRLPAGEFHTTTTADAVALASKLTILPDDRHARAVSHLKYSSSHVSRFPLGREPLVPTSGSPSTPFPSPLEEAFDPSRLPRAAAAAPGWVEALTGAASKTPRRQDTFGSKRTFPYLSTQAWQWSEQQGCQRETGRETRSCR